MWRELPQSQKQKYQQLITNFASLSECFAQKQKNSTDTVAPIINSKFQETAFQRSFHATGEDIRNTSFDASINSIKGQKYLVGIKTFGINFKYQKVAQFKKASLNWEDTVARIKKRKANNKEDLNKLNSNDYQYLAVKISKIRNERIKSSKSLLNGFQIENNTVVNSVYHVLMPSAKGTVPQISVGEISYSEIDISNIKITGATNIRTPQNFGFTDGHHNYRYTSSDSQLLMDFKNTDIVEESWPVTYLENPFRLFENLDTVKDQQSNSIFQSFTWMITDKNNSVPQKSGFNASFGASKTKNSKNQRPEDELYIPVPEAKKFNELYPDFFGINAGKLRNSTSTKGISKSVLAVEKSNRIFKLEFARSHDIIDAFLTQDTGKALQSVEKQSKMGKWILRKVLQVPYGTPVTTNILEQIEINAIRLIKYTDKSKPVTIDFTWVDPDNPPIDIWGWPANGSYGLFVYKNDKKFLIKNLNTDNPLVFSYKSGWIKFNILHYMQNQKSFIYKKLSDYSMARKYIESHALSIPNK